MLGYSGVSFWVREKKIECLCLDLGVKMHILLCYHHIDRPTNRHSVVLVFWLPPFWLLDMSLNSCCGLIHIVPWLVLETAIHPKFLNKEKCLVPLSEGKLRYLELTWFPT